MLFVSLLLVAANTWGAGLQVVMPAPQQWFVTSPCKHELSRAFSGCTVLRAEHSCRTAMVDAICRSCPAPRLLVYEITHWQALTCTTMQVRILLQQAVLPTPLSQSISTAYMLGPGHMGRRHMGRHISLVHQEQVCSTSWAAVKCSEQITGSGNCFVRQ